MRLGSLPALLLVAASVAAASPNESPAKVLARARTHFAAGRYDSTAQILQAFVKDNGKDPANEAVVPLLADALVRLRRDDFALRLLGIYAKKFPQSAYLPRCQYLEAVIDARQQRYQKAVTTFSSALNAGLNAELDSLSIRNIERLCDKVLSEGELTALAGSPGLNARAKEVIEYYALIKSYETGQVVKSRQNAEEFRKEYPRSNFAPAVSEIAARSKDDEREAVQIGLLAPLSGYDAEVSREVVQGIQLAVDRHNESGRMAVRLIVRDTRGSMVETARQTLSLLNEHRVQLFLGPVLSADAVVAAAALVGRDAVMISPTATDDGIAQLGPNIFQLNATLGSLAERIGEYSVKGLNIKEFAIISPRSDYGQAMSRRFRDRVEKLGGRIIDEQYFDEGTVDFQPQFRDLRTKLVALRQEKTAGELAADYAPTRRRFVADSIRFADSTLEIGGLFMPAEAEDVVMLAPQVLFHKVRTQMLGCTGWHNPKTVADGKRYVNNAVIATANDAGGGNERWEEFRAAYKARFRVEPTRVAALGYDAAEIMLKAVQEAGGGTDTKPVAQRVAATKDYAGVSGRISIDPATGANLEAAIVKISDKNFVRIQ